MRSLILLSAVVLAACGAPSVDVPQGNDAVTSDAPASDLPPPSVSGQPGSWPYAQVALHGNAGQAARILVEGAGNPVAAEVQPLDGTFCVNVELAAAPATYTLTIRSQATDGRLSEPATITIDRANDAHAVSDAKACDGTPIGG
ncbi:MAG TPA: hypothetical protein VIF62_03625 [Labilithrix sp.]|jgi:hypothetical protein